MEPLMEPPMRGRLLLKPVKLVMKVVQLVQLAGRPGRDRCERTRSRPGERYTAVPKFENIARFPEWGNRLEDA